MWGSGSLQATRRAGRSIASVQPRQRRVRMIRILNEAPGPEQTVSVRVAIVIGTGNQPAAH